MITFVYLGLLVVAGIGASVWAQKQVKKFDKKDVTPPPDKARSIVSQEKITKRDVVTGGKQSSTAGRSAQRSGYEEVA